MSEDAIWAIIGELLSKPDPRTRYLANVLRQYFHELFDTPES